MVTRQINECDHFRGTLTNLLRCSRLAVIHNLGKDAYLECQVYITTYFSVFESTGTLLADGVVFILFSHLSFTIEAKDLKADARRASSLDLV